jgi:hypothetical protein
MATAKKRTERLDLSLSLSAVDDVHHRFSTVVAAAYASVLGELTTRAVSKKIDVLASELVGNVLEHSTGKKAPLRVDLQTRPGFLQLRVTNRVSASVCDRIKRHVATIRRAADPKTLMAETMETRRAKGQMGGLGLIRLVAETKATLSVSYNKTSKLMRVTAQVPMGEQK